MTAEATQPARPSNDARIKAALWFAGQGFGVFSCWSARDDGVCRCPKGRTCSSPGKHPITEHGLDDATRDERAIRTALSAPSQPNYGLLPPEGVFVWDVDGEGWEAKLAALEAQHGPLPSTIRTATRHGQHIFLRWPDGHPRPLKAMFGWITRWGSGAQGRRGYVIGPRSFHASGFEYAPVGSFELATLPDAWAEAALAGEAPGTIRIGGEVDPSTVGVGSRHDFLRDRARFLAGVIRDPDALFAAVWAYNEKLPVPKSREDVERAIGDALTKFPADPVEVGEDGVARRGSDDEPGMLPPAVVGEFPDAPGAEAWGGLLGSCAEAISQGTDASPVGIIGSLLAFAGALIPGQAYHHRLQTTSPFVALVGESAVGRKGTAMWRAHDAMSDALEAVYVNRAILDGLNSGEGLISALAYKQTNFPHEPTVGLVFEEEYASLLAARGRDNSTLDPKMRAAFDGGPLSNRRSSQTQTVAPPYWLPALIAITPAELRRRLEADALQSGSANRWVYLPVRRREADPASDPPRFSEEDRTALQAARRWAMDRRPLLSVHPAVTATLAAYQDHLATVATGIAQDLTKRLPTTAFRIALIHAMAERSSQVSGDHLHRALALTEYARSGIPWVFGPSVGNRDADLLLRHLERSRTLTRRQAERLIRDTLRRQDAVDELSRLGYARVVTVQTGGRPRDELHLAAPRGTLSRFSHVPAYPQDSIVGTNGKNGRKSVEGVGKRWDEVVAEGGTNSPPEAVVDVTTGEVVDRSDATWASPCRDYEAHRGSHRNGAGGWICVVCEEER